MTCRTRAPNPRPTTSLSFVGPARVVGRLPDVPAATQVDVLVGLIRAATRWHSEPAELYRSHFAVSTATWQTSSGLSALALFGANASVELAPPGGPTWPDDRVARPMHLFNLHGATGSAMFLGHPGFAAAVRAADLGAAVTAGTVVAAECCFGAELYDPALSGGVLPFPLTYLSAGAHGYMGATCIAYGSRTSNAAADLLCRYFTEGVLAGASLGRALLEARQRYVHECPVMLPIDLKTLAQFVLLGDPSIQPVVIVPPDLTPAPAPPATAAGPTGTARSRPTASLGRSAGGTSRRTRWR